MNSPSTVLCTGPISEEAAALLAPFGDVVVAPDGGEATLMGLLGTAVGLVVRGDAITARALTAAPGLRVIGRSGAGYNNVDIAAATARKIPVVYTPGVNAHAVAEASLAMMLALCKHLIHWDRQLKAGQWSSRNDLRNEDLFEQPLGIVGFGNVGRALAGKALALGMTVMAHDPYADAAAARGMGVTLTDLDDLFARSKFISLHAAVTQENQGMIDRRRLALCRRGTYLVNLARGELVESLDVLHDALNNGTLAGVGLDVFAPEPPDVRHPIFTHPCCLTAPHALGMTRNVMNKIFRQMAGDMAAVLRGERVKNVVNPQVWA